MNIRSNRYNQGIIKEALACYLLAYCKYQKALSSGSDFDIVAATGNQSGSGQGSTPGGSNSGAAGAGGQGSRGGDDDITSGSDREKKLGSDGNFVGKATGNQVDETGVGAATGGTTVGAWSEVDEVKVGGVATGDKSTKGPEGGIDEQELRNLSGEGRVVTEGTASATPEEQTRITGNARAEQDERRSSVDAGTGAGSAYNKVNPDDVDDATGTSQRPYPRDTDDIDRGAERETLGNP
jgi:hypothetical protein